MACNDAVGDVQVIFGRANEEIQLDGFNADSLSIKDDLSAKGITASFTSQVLPGRPFPAVQSLCLIREVTGSGFRQIFVGYYSQAAVEIKEESNEFSFSIDSLINYCQREEIEEYSLTRTLTDHITNALEESGAKIAGNALTLLDLQTISGEDNIAFPFEFKLGTLENFLDTIVAGRGRWRVKPVPWVSYAAKTTGSFGVIEVILSDGATNKSVPGKLDERTDHCGDTNYLKVIGPIKENRQPPIASRWIVAGRNSRKPPTII